MTHDAAEFENRFWTIMAFLLAYTFVFVSDSPFRLPSDQIFISWFIVFAITFLAHNYNRHLHRNVLRKVPNVLHIRRVTSLEFLPEERNNILEKLQSIHKYISFIDNPWISSNILNIFFLPWMLYYESMILNMFAETNKNELNYIISNLSLSLILYKIKDHWVVQRFNRTKLLNMLCYTRLTELTLTSRVILLDAIMRMKLSAHKKSELYVKNIILATKSDDLSTLKSLMDSKLDINSTHQLIFVEIRSEEVKQHILHHIKKEATIQAAHGKIGSKFSKVRGKFAWKKILSDVDDTLLCSAGSYPAGIDRSYPKKSLYPGVLAFYRELDLGATTSDQTWVEGRLGNLVFLSARPHVYKNVSEEIVYEKFRTLQETRGLHTCPSLLAGSLDTGGQFMINNDFEPLARKKYDNFKEYIKLYPEYSCIFIGDNGQGDVRTAEMVLNDEFQSAGGDDTSIKNNLERVYIHEVQPLTATHAKNSLFKSRNCPKVCYFNTYIDAAIDAFNHKLIRIGGLRRIMEESIVDFKKISNREWRTDEKYSLSSTVMPAGNGNQGLRKRPLGMGSIQVSPIGITFSNKALTSPRAQTQLRTTAAITQQTFEVFQTREPKRESRLRELNTSLTKGNKILLLNGQQHQSQVKLIRYDCRFPVGCPVVTLFGVGVVTKFRDCDGLYEVMLQWDPTGDARKIPTMGYFQGALIAEAPSVAVYKRINNVTSIASSSSSLALSASSKVSSSGGSKMSSSASAVRTSNLVTSSSLFSAYPSPPCLLSTLIKKGINSQQPQTLKSIMPYSPSTSQVLELPCSIKLQRINGNRADQPHVKDKKDKERESERISKVKGALAWTPYGRAYIIDHRVLDNKIIVYYPWGAFGFLQAVDVVQLTSPSDTVEELRQRELERLYQASKLKYRAELSSSTPAIGGVFSPAQSPITPSKAAVSAPRSISSTIEWLTQRKPKSETQPLKVQDVTTTSGSVPVPSRIDISNELGKTLELQIDTSTPIDCGDTEVVISPILNQENPMELEGDSIEKEGKVICLEDSQAEAIINSSHLQTVDEKSNPDKFDWNIVNWEPPNLPIQSIDTDTDTDGGCSDEAFVHKCT